MNPRRRRWLLTLAALGAGAAGPARPAGEAGADTVRRGRRLEFPRDHGAHLAARIEWWYATGWAGRGEPPQPRLPGHLLPQPHRAGAATTRAASRRGNCCSRTPR